MSQIMADFPSIVPAIAVFGYLLKIWYSEKRNMNANRIRLIQNEYQNFIATLRKADSEAR